MRAHVLCGMRRNYERSAITMWIELDNSHFPGGAAKITSKDLTTNDTLREEILAWKLTKASV